MANGEAGRPTKCTPELIEEVCRLIASGMPKRHAYAKVGIHHTTALDWDRRGAEGEEPYAAFSTARAKADADHVALRLERMQTPGNDWKREAWLLERLHPRDFAQVNKTQLSGPDGAPIQAQAVAQVVVVPEVAATADAWAAKHGLTPPGTDEE